MKRAELSSLTQSVIRLDHLCCGKEVLLARELLAPYSEISDVKISLTDRRASIEHRTSLPASEIVRVLNSGHLGASVSEAVDWSGPFPAWDDKVLAMLSSFGHASFRPLQREVINATLAAKDVFVWGPNGTGLILGLVQLALKLLYPTK